jgi:hypothetical protein
MLHPITAVWDTQYRLGIFEDVYPTSKTRSNLMHLSNTNPLLFEEVLVFLETAPTSEQRLMAHRIMGNSMHPSERRPETTYFGQYRSLIDSASLLIELSADGKDGWQTQAANSLLGDARKCVDSFEHPHFRAAALATWIMQKHDKKRTRLAYTDHAEGIAFIAANLRDVMSVRDELARIGSINKDDIERMINTSNALRIGSL